MNDLIKVIKVVDDEDLKVINDYIDTLTFNENTVFYSDNKAKVNTSVRSSLGSFMDDNHEVTQLLHNKINDCLLDYRNQLIKINSIFEYYPVPGGYHTSSHREGIQILEYSLDQGYKFHHDVSNNPNSKEYHRQISVVIYLNDGFEGGGTEFPHQTFKPPAGYGLFFPSNWSFPHSGQKVLSGKKRAAVTWYYMNDHSA